MRDVDYTIDYLFGTVELRGEAAGSLTPDSNIQVNYQYSPFFGGGNTTLMGFNLGYDLGRESTRADLEAFLDLYPSANARVLGRIVQAPLPRSYYSKLRIALDNATVYGSRVVSDLGCLDPRFGTRLVRAKWWPGILLGVVRILAVPLWR